MDVSSACSGAHLDGQHQVVAARPGIPYAPRIAVGQAMAEGLARVVPARTGAVAMDLAAMRAARQHKLPRLVVEVDGCCWVVRHAQSVCGAPGICKRAILVSDVDAEILSNLTVSLYFTAMNDVNDQRFIFIKAQIHTPLKDIVQKGPVRD